MLVRPDAEDLDLRRTARAAGAPRARFASARAYEGPPRHVHGGLLAAMFDKLLGRSQLGSRLHRLADDPTRRRASE